MIVPSIDFSKLGESQEQQKLDDVCRSHGFFALVNHGIDTTAKHTFFSTMSDYFSQPLATKIKQERTVDNPFGFYNKELTKNRLDNKEVFDISLNKDASTLWPNSRAFINETTRWHNACHHLAMQLVKVAFKNLGLALEVDFFEAHTSFLRLNYYPSLPAANAEEAVYGVSHHTDAGALTVLCQDDVASLQFELDGQWYTAPAIEGQFLINLGDMLQVWSNDQYKAPLHRVLTNPHSDRYSAPYFLNPANSCDVKPLATQTPRYRTVNWKEFRHGRASGDYADLGSEIQISDYRL